MYNVLGIMLLIGLILYFIVKQASDRREYNRAPEVTVNATVVTKRQEYYHHADSASHTDYYVCFQMEGGDRVELSLEGQEYGLLAEGDRGKLTFKGTRYLRFEREGA